MRTWFSYAPPMRPVRGGLVIDLQLVLARSGFLASVDGIYAGQTKTALQEWQKKYALAQSGAVDEATWKGLTNTSSPPLFRRCLSLTAAFEGHGYTLAVGNFDDAYLTWGIIGFTLKHGDLGEVIRRVEAGTPGLLAQTIGADKAGELFRIINAPDGARRNWGDSLSVGANKYGLRTDWKDAFEILGNRPEVRAAQDAVAHDHYWERAIKDMRAHGRLTEIDAALFFDTAVQNGGVDFDKAAAIGRAVAGLNNPSTRERLQRTAAAIASMSKAEYQGDVLSRRGAIASGRGNVHGANYDIENWGLTDAPVSTADLA